jgi:deoxycytidylate deaminase
MTGRPTWDMTWMSAAHGVARRSLCTRDKVGAVIVAEDNTPLISTYNGPPSGYEHNDRPCIEWCPRSRGDVHRWRMTSKTQPFVAPNLETTVDGDGILVRLHAEDVWNRLTEQDMVNLGWTKETVLSPDYSDCPALHAEANAISRSSHVHRRGGTIYVTSDVCHSCAKLIANAGLSRVVVDRTKPRGYRNSEKSYDFLRTCKIIVDFQYGPTPYPTRLSQIDPE